MGLHDWIGKTRRAGLIVAACGLLAACGFSPEQDRAAIERDILATPGGQELWRTIREEYPQDFDALVGQIQALDFGERRDAAKVEQIGTKWLQQFFDRITPHAVKAPAEPLIAWSATEAALYSTLQRGAVNDCAAMTMGKWIFIDESNVAATSAIARRNAAMVRASAAGRADPQDYSDPDERAFEQLGDSIAATGIDPQLQAALGSDLAMMALTPAQQCEIGVAVYQGLSDLPDDVEPAMAAYMLSPE